jgi:type VI secretion system protein ImpC
MLPTDTDFETEVTLETEAIPFDEDTPFRILFLGDWSGKNNRSLDFKAKNLSPIEIDRDNFDDVIQKLDVKLNLDFQGDGENVLPLTFTKLDDFHPDMIFQQVSIFENLLDIRKKLLNKNTFNEAAREVRSWITSEDSQEASSEEKYDVSKVETNAESNDLLDQILNKSEDLVSSRSSQNIQNTDLNKFVSQLVKPHLIQTDTTEQSNLLIIVDEIISDLMRKILHHPEFQTLESAWRGLYFLVSRVETNANLKIDLLNISKDELINNLKSVENLTDSFLLKTLNSGTLGISGVEYWSVMCGNYTFSIEVENIATLIRLAKIGDTLNIPFVSCIKPEMFGFESFGEVENFDRWNVSQESNQNKLWMALRSLPEAKSLGLMLPRFLIRLPYGEKTEPTENFYFEEFVDFIEHNQYLWVNPAFAFALLLAETFNAFGWDISKNLFLDIEDLPIHLYKEGGEQKTKPCTEILMTQFNCEYSLSQGLMPLISFTNTDRIRLGGFQSVAESISLLRGKWN